MNITISTILAVISIALHHRGQGKDKLSLVIVNRSEESKQILLSLSNFKKINGGFCIRSLIETGAKTSVKKQLLEGSDQVSFTVPGRSVSFIK